MVQKAFFENLGGKLENGHSGGDLDGGSKILHKKRSSEGKWVDSQRKKLTPFGKMLRGLAEKGKKTAVRLFNLSRNRNTNNGKAEKKSISSGSEVRSLSKFRSKESSQKSRDSRSSSRNTPNAKKSGNVRVSSLHSSLKAAKNEKYTSKPNNSEKEPPPSSPGIFPRFSFTSGYKMPNI